jgi:uncharacterized protein (UPF0335 family)
VTLTNFGSVAGDQLQAFIDRVERLEEEIAVLNNDKKEVYAEARGNGFDVKVIRKIVAIRKMDHNERMEAGERPPPPARRPPSITTRWQYTASEWGAPALVAVYSHLLASTSFAGREPLCTLAGASASALFGRRGSAATEPSPTSTMRLTTF